MKTTKRKTKRRITLIEIMIVMFLIAMITGVLAYNFQGTIDKGKAFKTKEAISKVEAILTLRLAEDPDLSEDIESNWKEIIQGSPLVHDPSALEKDGWGGPFQVHMIHGNVKVTSARYEQYLREKGK